MDSGSEFVFAIKKYWPGRNAYWIRSFTTSKIVTNDVSQPSSEWLCTIHGGMLCKTVIAMDMVINHSCEQKTLFHESSHTLTSESSLQPHILAWWFKHDTTSASSTICEKFAMNEQGVDYPIHQTSQLICLWCLNLI